MKILLVFCLLMTCGCASLVSEKRYEVKVDSHPRDALVRIENREGKEIYAKRTPFYVDLDAKASYFKKAKYNFNFQKEGYIPTNYILKSDIDGWYFGNLLYLPLGGAVTVIGAVGVDPWTGAMWELDDRVWVTLEKE
jgi:hypothetical protein